MEFNLHVFGDQALLELTGDHLLPGNILHIHNDYDNPADQIFLSLPELLSSTALVNWCSKVDLLGKEADLIILLNSDTNIQEGDFQKFKEIFITDQKVLEKKPNSVILHPQENHNAKLTVNHFIANKSYLLCNQVSLIGGDIKDLLAIKLHGSNSQVKLSGIDKDHRLVVDKLNIDSEVDLLQLDNVITNKNLHYTLAKTLLIKDSFANNKLLLSSQKIDELSLNSRGETDITSESSMLITHINSPNGKFYIAANSYIHFKTDSKGLLYGLDLVLDMSQSTLPQKEIVFPDKEFRFDSVTILGASKVSIPYGGSTKELLLKDCGNIELRRISAHSVKYSSTTKSSISCDNSKIYQDFLMLGNISATFKNIELNNLEASGTCSVSFIDKTQCTMLKLNLNIDASNPNNTLQNNLSINIENKGKEPSVIGTILAKLSTFYVKGYVKLGTVLIQPIDKISTLFWVDMTYGTRLTADKIFVGFDHDIMIDPSNGNISIQRTKNVLKGSEMFSSISNTKVKNFVFVKSGMGIRFDGSLEVIDGDLALFSKYGDIFLKGHLKASEKLIVSASSGSVMLHGAKLDAKLITVYSGTNTYLEESLVKAQDFVAYALGHYIQTDNTNLQACRIALIAKEDVVINSSSINSTLLTMSSGGNNTILDSDIITHNIFTQSVRDFMLYNSNINLLQCSYSLFAIPGNNPGLIQGGYQIGNDLTLVGIFTPDRSQLLPQLKWQEVGILQNTPVERGSAYINASNGIIVGSTIDAKHSVIIKASNSLYVVPLALHNEIMSEGGMNKKSIGKVVTRINAGLIDIDAKQAFSLVQTLLKAESNINLKTEKGTFIDTNLTSNSGNIEADILSVIASPEEIERQQARIRELNAFAPKPTIGQTIGEYFNFSHSTAIKQRIGNLGIYDNYSSQNLSFTQIGTDIVFNQSWHNKYDSLHLNVEKGKILIVSNNLQNIYTGNGGGIHGKHIADSNRTVIGGNNIYLVADQIVMQGSKFAVKGDLKIVAKDGIYMLPVAVHERLMYHMGSKTKIEESVVRQVISEINAGFVDIKSGGVFEAVSSLIQATGVNIDAKELKLRAEHEIFERHVYFTGAKKWYGGRNSSADHFYDAFVLPTTISANTIYAKISGDTTIEAANILAKEESLLQSGGNVSIFNKYDIHLHDHVSKKSFLFNCHGGKLTIGSTKTVKEHYYAEAPAPTVYYCGGSFFAYSEGKIHLLGAKIIANDIYLTAKEGVKIEATPYKQEKFITISETGFRTGYNIGSGNYSLSGELFQKEDSLSLHQLRYEASEVIAKGNLLINSQEGNLDIISSRLQFGKAEIKVRGLNIHTHQEVLHQETTSTGNSTGLNIGIQETVTSAVNKAGNLINKNGTHCLDILDRGLNGYEFYKEASNIREDINSLVSNSGGNQISNLQKLQSVKFGVWVGANSLHSSTTTTEFNAIDTELIGGDIDIQVDEKAVIEGIRCQVDNFKLKAKNLEITTSHDTKTHETFTSNVSLTVPISGSVSGGVNFQNSEGGTSGIYHHSNNMIIAKGRLEVDIAEDGKVSGVRLQASDVLVRAKNLVVESLEDVLQEKLRSLELSIGTQGNLGIKPQVTSRDSAWTNAIGSIIGTQVANVVVQQTLEIAGSLIANAEVHENGSFTDKGNLSLKAGTIIAKNLHDYDNGKSFGLGIALNRKTDAKGNASWGLGMPVTCSFSEKARDILPTIGNGEISVVDLGQGSGLVNQNVNSFIGSTTKEGGSLKSSIPVSDIANYLHTAIKSKPQIEVADKEVYDKEKVTVLTKGAKGKTVVQTGVSAETNSNLQDLLSKKEVLEENISDISKEELDQYYKLINNIQDEPKPLKLFDIKAAGKIGGNDHGLNKDSFVRHGKEVTSYRNSSGQFTKKPSPYNYSINANVPLVSFGGEGYKYDLVDRKEWNVDGIKLHVGLTSYVVPYLNTGLSNGINSNLGWQSGILVGGAEFDDGSKLTANIFETSGGTEFNIGKSGFDAKAGFKASIANVKYSMPISEKCGIGYCFEGDVTFEAGLGISAKAEIGLSNKKLKANLGLGSIVQGELSVDGSFSVNEQYVIARQKNLEQMQTKYDHFDSEIKKYNPDVIAKISVMDLFDFGNHEDFESILMLAKAYSKK